MEIRISIEYQSADKVFDVYGSSDEVDEIDFGISASNIDELIEQLKPELKHILRVEKYIADGNEQKKGSNVQKKRQ